MAYTDIDGISFSEDRKTLIKCPNSYSGEYIIPEGTTTIANGAFSGCVKLSALTLPSSLGLIEVNAFSNCKTLGTIRYNGNLRDWLTKISCKATTAVGYNLWLREGDGYVKLCKAIIPKDVTEIREMAFYYCSSLTSVEWHTGITKLCNNCFNKSNFSSTLWVPDSVTYIGQYAFLGCNNLVNVHIPESVAFIGIGCFSFCSRLFSIKVEEDNSYFSSDEKGSLLFDKFKTKLLQCVCKPTYSCQLCRSCKEIQDFAFVGCGKFKVYLSDIQSKVQNVKDCSCEFMIPFGQKDKYCQLGFPKSQLTELYDEDLLIKSGKEHLDIVENNPFRILGVSSNASAKEITGNSTKIKRFSAAGKKVAFPTDFEEQLGTVDRSPESIEAALSKINLQDDKFKYSLFWFVKMCEEDGRALELLSEDKIDDYVDFCFDDANYDRFSIKYNLAISSLIREKWRLSEYASDILNIFRNDEYRKAFISSVCGDTASYSSDEISRTIVDTLLQECDAQQLYLYYNDAYNQTWAANYVKDKVIGSYISLITEEISTAKAIACNDSEANLKAANKLISKTKKALQQAKEFLPDNDPQFEMISDSLAKQILQSGINYYNSTDDDDAVFQAFKVQSYAESIAIGSLAKGRCKENVDILRKIMSSVPPKGCKQIDAEIENCLKYGLTVSLGIGQSPIDKIISALERCAEHIVKLYNYADNENLTQEEREHCASYIKSVSTKIGAKTLNDSIDIVNGFNKGNSYSEVRTFISKAWKVMCYISSLDLQDDFRKNRFEPNNKTLGEMYDKVVGNSESLFHSGRAAHKLDLRSEKALYSQCPNSTINCKLYLQKYPAGKFVDEVKSYAETLEWKAANTIEKIEAYKKNYPSGKYISQADAKITEYHKTAQEIRAMDSREQLKAAHEKYKGSYLHSIVDDCYYQKCHTKSQCKEYISLFGYSGKHHSEAKARAEKDHTVLCWILGILTTGLIGGLIGAGQDEFWTGVAIGTFGNLLLPVCYLPMILWSRIIDGKD